MQNDQLFLPPSPPSLHSRRAEAMGSRPGRAPVGVGGQDQPRAANPVVRRGVPFPSSPVVAPSAAPPLQQAGPPWPQGPCDWTQLLTWIGFPGAAETNYHRLGLKVTETSSGASSLVSRCQQGLIPLKTRGEARPASSSSSSWWPQRSLTYGHIIPVSPPFSLLLSPLCLLPL